MSELSACGKIIKYLLLLFNLVLLISGIAMICTGVAVSVKFSIPMHFVANHQSDRTLASVASAFSSAPTLLMLSGVIIVIITIFGCLGATKEGPCLIGTFAVLLFIACITEFSAAGGIASWRKLDENADQKISDAFDQLIVDYNDTDFKESNMIDTIQIMFKCCGNTDLNDWEKSEWSKSKGDPEKHFPLSCCGLDKHDEENAEKLCSKDMVEEKHEKGCKVIFQESVQDNAGLIIGTGVTMGVIQIFGIIFSCIFIKQLRAGAGYQPQYNNY
ncbi:Oidioi.mRNA.OKI2018_I69.PAR.g12365.t1.cds [Oikopleura dioica]|uniref:Tetraspanin n=1 Tax=Oikopleura dioica TaxID=34765 RepID=A0ABN7RZP5_OIKDI|nr:Oidioi.mRNA.OKI2018_I69.PAR.g12365.t1.cds [Oikopleura dioica]